MRAGFHLTRALGVAIAVPALIALAACAVSREQSPENPASAKAADAQVTAAPGAAEPAYQQQGGGTSIDQVLADLQRAEGDLGVAIEALSASQGRKSPAGMPAPGATGDAVGPSAAQRPPATSPARPGEAELTSDPCFSACRALASMTRATAHLCDLAGDADPRCDSARSRLRGARERVEGSCACGPPD